MHDEDAELSALMERAREAVRAAGLTVQDLLDQLPAARAEVMAELYGADFMEELHRQWLAVHSADTDTS